MQHYTFTIGELEPLTEHTMSAADHRELYGLPATAAPALWLCLDPTAIFLTSNGEPGLRDQEGHVVRVYAIGHTVADGNGGDGSCELIPAEDMAEGIERARSLGRDTLTVRVGSVIEILV